MLVHYHHHPTMSRYDNNNSSNQRNRKKGNAKNHTFWKQPNKNGGVSVFDELAYETKRLDDHLEQNTDSMEEYRSSKNMILSICNDMQTHNPDLQDDLTKIINELRENTKIVEKIHTGGGLTDSVTRLSSISGVERIPTTQGRFTESEIQERLERFTIVTTDEIFQLPKGIWIRYFLKSENNPSARGLYRTGGFVIHKDPDRRYITLVSGHNQGKNSYTWNMQMTNVHSIYAMKKNVKKFRYDRIDRKHRFRPGVTGMLSTYLPYNQMLLKQWVQKDPDIRLVLYDVVEHVLYTPRPNQKRTSFLKKHKLNVEYVKQMITSGLEYQFENLTNGALVVGVIHANDLPSIRKRKSKLRE